MNEYRKERGERSKNAHYQRCLQNKKGGSQRLVAVIIHIYTRVHRLHGGKMRNIMRILNAEGGI